nr:LYR motif-containing protein 4 isoform X2 [Pan troglodytes]
MPRNPTLPTRIGRSQVTLEIPQALSGSAEGDRSRRGRGIGGQGRGVGAAAFGNPGNAASWGLQSRTSVSSVPGDAEREQAFQRLQLQNICCQEDKRCLQRK